MNDELRRELGELSGAIELAMHDQALVKARSMLQDERICAEVFHACVEAILIGSDNVQSWLKAIDTAYERLPQNDQEAARLDMLRLSFTADDLEKAQSYLAEEPQSVEDAFFTIETLLACGRLDEAKSLGEQVEGFDLQDMSEAEANVFHCVLADLNARCGEWDEAVAHWEDMQLDGPLGDRAARCLVQIGAAEALLRAEEGLKAIEAKRKDWSFDTDPMLAGIEEQLMANLEHDLRGYISALDAVVPQERRNEFGMEQ